MFAITCPQCGKKLNAKKELAGKKVRCPQCKHVVAIPTAMDEGATVPPRIAHELSDADTIPPADAAHSEPPKARPITNGKTTEAIQSAILYEVAEEIARGGMGAIKRAVDRDIRREVAVKFLLNAADARQRARFVEEAQITGQLEHPNIVPIHHLGVHEDGQCFFSMKMVKGRSLGEILKDENCDYTLGKLLAILVSICNAMAYAHSRQVIHRDLKPANVMVGDFGEVYVMDWGLAKVLGQESASSEHSGNTTDIQRRNGSAETTQVGEDSGTRSLDKVTTNRLAGSELTQAGAIMGTPAYMAPEQALGHDVDTRADIYSLGAILYEIMTRTPPVGRGGDLLAIVTRVAEGRIEPPQQRAPKRAEAGWTPSELSAVAMKALALKREDRYTNVESLKHDIELFLEGRSVSAKHDTLWEMFRKLIRRNKAASLMAAASFVVLFAVVGYFLKINYDRRLEAEGNFAQFKEEQSEKEKRTREAVPALIQAAHLNVERLAPEQATAQVNLALVYAPDNADARLLKAQLLVARKQFAEGARELEVYLKARPKDYEAEMLLDLCKVEQPQESSNLLKITAVLVRHKVPGLAESILKEFGPNLHEARRQLLEMYRARLEKGWPGWGSRLTVDNSGLFRLTTKQLDEIATLDPLAGIPLSAIDITGTTGRSTRFAVTDLSPLKGMPLTSLKIRSATQLRDLSPLEGMPLETLSIGYAELLSDLSPLHDMPLISLRLEHSKELSDLSPLQGMPLTSLDLKGCAAVVDLTPLEGMKLTSVTLQSTVLSSRSSVKILRDMPTLKSLWFSGLGAFTPEELWKKYDAGTLSKK